MPTFDDILSDPYFAKLDRELSKFNIFHATDMKNREIKHTKFLGYLLDPNESHQLGTKFLWEFLRKLAATGINGLDLINLNLEYAKINIEYKLKNSRKRLDLLLEIPTNTNPLIIAIENKIKSAQGDDQLRTYRENINGKLQGNKKFIYLTINEDEPNDTEEWKNVTYAETVVPAIKELLSGSEETLAAYLRFILQDYIEIIEKDEDQIDSSFEIYKLINQEIKTKIRNIKSIRNTDENSPEYKLQILYPRAIDYIKKYDDDIRLEIVETFNKYFDGKKGLKPESSNRIYLRFTFLSENFRRFLSEGICSSPTRRWLDSKVNLACEIEMRPTQKNNYTTRSKITLGTTNENFHLRREFVDMICKKLGTELGNRKIRAHTSTITNLDAPTTVQQNITPENLPNSIQNIIENFDKIKEKIRCEIEESIKDFIEKYEDELLKIGVPENIINACK